MKIKNTIAKSSLHDKNIVWVIRSFLDYRVPVFAELHRLLGGRLHILYSKEFTPERTWRKLEAEIGASAIGLSGERALGYKGNITVEMANSHLRFPFQPGLRQKIKVLNPDILIGDGFFQWTWPAALHRALSGTPLVVCYERTIHTERHAQWYRTLFRKIMNLRTPWPGCLGCLAAITTGMANNMSMSIIGEQWTPATTVLAYFIGLHILLNFHVKKQRQKKRIRRAHR